MNRYEQLKNDLKYAVEKATEIAYQTDDGGTCNFDSCILYLPRYNKDKTLETIKETGIRAFKGNYYGKVCYILENPVYAQADRNTIQAEIINKIMGNKGYNVGMYYQMD